MSSAMIRSTGALVTGDVQRTADEAVAGGATEEVLLLIIHRVQVELSGEVALYVCKDRVYTSASRASLDSTVSVVLVKWKPVYTSPGRTQALWLLTAIITISLSKW